MSSWEECISNIYPDCFFFHIYANSVDWVAELHSFLLEPVKLDPRLAVFKTLMILGYIALNLFLFFPGFWNTYYQIARLPVFCPDVCALG